MLDRLFVYGTLRRAFDNEHARMLHARSDFLGEYSVPGEIYSVQWYTGFIAGRNGTVHGELFRLHDPEPTLAALDEYEGEDFERVEIAVDGEPAWIYGLRRLPAGAKRISSGDFCAG